MVAARLQPLPFLTEPVKVVQSVERNIDDSPRGHDGRFW